MHFDDIDKVGAYTGNTKVNKTIKANERITILKGLLQLFENSNKIMRQLNAYDSSSIILSEGNWIKRNHFSRYMPLQTSAVKKICTGFVCTIDYGKTYKGEIGYVHPGLCVGKRDNKYLIVPMTTGKTWRQNCFHPIYNPTATKDTRMSCVMEGFSKDGVLLIHDTKFISGGRILDVHEKINDDILYEIQNQILKVMFPNQNKEIEKIRIKKVKLENTIENQNRQIENLKKIIDKLSNENSLLKEFLQE